MVRWLLLLAALSSLAYGQIMLNTSQASQDEQAPEVAISVIEDESVTFRCQAITQTPTLNIRDPGSSTFGSTLPPNLMTIDPLTFEFINVSRSDNGFAFQCRAGAGFTDIGVIVVLYAPIYTSPGPQTVTEGDTNVQINITIDANPFPSFFTWSRNGWPITSSSNVALTATSITFTTVRREDAGMYTVSSNNTAGDGSTTFELIVQFPPTITISPGNLRFRGNVSTVFAIMTGATGYLECTTVGVPTPNVTLTTDAVDSNVMVNGSRVVVTSAVAGNAGNYTCNASNFLGFDEQTFELLVGSVPTVNNLMLNVTSDTQVVITWTFNDNGVPIDSFEVTTTCGTTIRVSPVDVPTMGYEVTFTQDLPPDLLGDSECRVRVTATNLLGNGALENVIPGATMMTTSGGAAISAAISVLLLILTSLVF